MKKILLLSLFMLASCGASPSSDHQVKSFTIVSLNDVYKIKPSDEGLGGFARLKTIQEQLRTEDPNLLTFHGGDFLSPAPISNHFAGEQMIDVLNSLNGEGDSFDDRFFIVPGNHEFDMRGAEGAVTLNDRIKQSRFTWITSNIGWEDGTHAALYSGRENLVKSKVIEIAGLKVGIFGLTIASNSSNYAPTDDAYVDVATRMSAMLRGRGVDVVIALTHLDIDSDQVIMDSLGTLGPDLILGGHEHIRSIDDIDGRKILKADSDLESVGIVKVSVKNGVVSIDASHKDVGAMVNEDPTVKARVDAWHNRYNAELCGAEAGVVCGNEVIGHTRVTLKVKSGEIRRFEVGTLNWMADEMLKRYAGVGAQVAFINSGTVRINRDIEPKELLSKGLVNDLLPFDPTLHLIELTGKELKDVLSISASGWVGKGHWLQIAGMAYRHNPDSETATDIHIKDGDSYRPLTDGETVRAVTVGYLLDPAGPQDGYTLLGPDNMVENAVGPTNLVKTLIKAIEDAEPVGIFPKVEGRICTVRRPDKCLIPNS